MSQLCLFLNSIQVDAQLQQTHLDCAAPCCAVLWVECQKWKADQLARPSGTLSNTLKSRIQASHAKKHSTAQHATRLVSIKAQCGAAQRSRSDAVAETERDRDTHTDTTQSFGWSLRISACSTPTPNHHHPFINPFLHHLTRHHF